MNAFHLHVQLGCVAQGLLQHLALNHMTEVWRLFRSLVAHHESRAATSELVVACALRATLPDFLQAAVLPYKLRIILRRYTEPKTPRYPTTAERRSRMRQRELSTDQFWSYLNEKVAQASSCPHNRRVPDMAKRTYAS